MLNALLAITGITAVAAVSVVVVSFGSVLALEAIRSMNFDSD